MSAKSVIFLSFILMVNLSFQISNSCEADNELFDSLNNIIKHPDDAQTKQILDSRCYEMGDYIRQKSDDCWLCKYSKFGDHKLCLQGVDGNFVYYEYTSDLKAVARWATMTVHDGVEKLAVQSDGNVVLYNSAMSPLWNSGTSGQAYGRVTRLCVLEKKIAVYAGNQCLKRYKFDIGA
mmetsp:Transcript_42041/g.44071  ORF Transcript_42041/g.44071 Transcript_42041/m.44071 type:complete len:178 (-) Transcript_42041:5-538(-)